MPFLAFTISQTAIIESRKDKKRRQLIAGLRIYRNTHNSHTTLKPIFEDAEKILKTQSPGWFKKAKDSRTESGSNLFLT